MARFPLVKKIPDMGVNPSTDTVFNRISGEEMEEESTASRTFSTSYTFISNRRHSIRDTIGVADVKIWVEVEPLESVDDFCRLEISANKPSIYRPVTCTEQIYEPDICTEQKRLALTRYNKGVNPSTDTVRRTVSGEEMEEESTTSRKISTCLAQICSNRRHTVRDIMRVADAKMWDVDEPLDSIGDNDMSVDDYRRLEIGPMSDSDRENPYHANQPSIYRPVTYTELIYEPDICTKQKRLALTRYNKGVNPSTDTVCRTVSGEEMEVESTTSRKISTGLAQICSNRRHSVRDIMGVADAMIRDVDEPQDSIGDNDMSVDDYCRLEIGSMSGSDRENPYPANQRFIYRPIPWCNGLPPLLRNEENETTDDVYNGDINGVGADDSAIESFRRELSVIPNLTCCYCGTMLRDIVALAKHFGDLQEDGFCSPSSLFYHKFVHADIIPYPCDICGKTFRTKDYLISHRWVHERRFTCTECGKSFESGESLRIHRNIHIGITPTSARRHVLKHTGVKSKKSYPCGICGKILGRSHSLTEHMERHSTERSYRCDHCSSRFRTRTCLRQHVKIHMEKQFTCQFCPMKFARKYGKILHERTHTDRS